MTDPIVVLPHTPTQPHRCVSPADHCPSNDSLLGEILHSAHSVRPEVSPTYGHVPLCANPSTSLSPAFLHVMDQIRMHLERKVRGAGWLGPLDFTWADFADLFSDLPIGEGRLAVFRSLNIWYRTIYVEHRYWENSLRNLYEDNTPLTRQQEASFFEIMRNGSPYVAARYRELFLRRNEGLVGQVVNRYMGMGFLRLDLSFEEGRSSPHIEGSKHERELLFSAGYEGLRKAVDRFKPELGNKFSTYAVPWIVGEITALFKEAKAEMLDRLRFQHKPEPTPFEPRPAEDYLELHSAVRQALDRLNDPRKSQIIISHFGLFGRGEETLCNIGQRFDISPQRVRAIVQSSLKHLKKDRELYLFYKSWFWDDNTSAAFELVSKRAAEIFFNGS